MDAFLGQILCCSTAKDNEQQEQKKEPKGSQNNDTIFLEIERKENTKAADTADHQLARVHL